MIPRLYLDEDLPPLAAELLRNRGFDVVSAHDIGLLAVGDDVQLERAASDGRAILTCNYGHFTRLATEWFEAGRRHRGIVISFHQYRRDQIRQLVATIEGLLTQIDSMELENTFRALDDFIADAAAGD